MERRAIAVDVSEYPAELREYLSGARLYDSSCSPQAKVIFADKDGGYYIKRSEKGSLKTEADMTDYFATKGLSSKVLCYISDKEDWLVTERIAGEDCVYRDYLDSPKKLCDLLSRLLRELHDSDFDECPVRNRNEIYLQTAEKNYKSGVYDRSYLHEGVSHLDIDGAYKYITERNSMLKTDALLHGDYCLPNIILDGFKFSGFIDLGNGGAGDRHIDLFWGAWTLNYNLKTDIYRDRFFDGYGRELVDGEMIKLISVIEAFG